MIGRMRKGSFGGGGASRPLRDVCKFSVSLLRLVSIVIQDRLWSTFFVSFSDEWFLLWFACPPSSPLCSIIYGFCRLGLSAVSICHQSAGFPFLCQDCFGLLVTHFFPYLESKGERFLRQGIHEEKDTVRHWIHLKVLSFYISSWNAI